MEHVRTQKLVDQSSRPKSPRFGTQLSVAKTSVHDKAPISNQLMQQLCCNSSIQQNSQTSATIARSAISTSPTRLVTGPDGSPPVKIYDNMNSARAAQKMGTFGFSYRDSIFLGGNPGFPEAPSKDQVQRHEMVHVLQGRRPGIPANQDKLENQAHGNWWQGVLLTADPEVPYGFAWVPFLIAAGYILLKPNTANAPGPGDKTYKSMTPKDYAKMTAEATVLVSGGAIASALRSAGYSLITTWGVSGAAGSMSFRGVQDAFAGSFSGVDTYVIDGLTGATVGIVVGGTFHALGKVPGISRIRDWYGRGSSNDKAWSQLSAKDKMYYEIGQKTLSSADDFAKISHLSPVERGRLLVQQQGWTKALMPQSGKFVVPGEGGTLSTGPTPAARWFAPRVTGFGAGATGNYLLGDDVRNFYGVGMESYGTGGSSVIIVVPEGKELEYYMKSGQLGDFPLPPVENDINEYDEFRGSGGSGLRSAEQSTPLTGYG